MPFTDALVDATDLPYVLGLHEGPLVAMADGFARATRRPSFVNLHVAAGLANGLIGLLNARRSRTPVHARFGKNKTPESFFKNVGLALAALEAEKAAAADADLGTRIILPSPDEVRAAETGNDQDRQ